MTPFKETLTALITLMVPVYEGEIVKPRSVEADAVPEYCKAPPAKTRFDEALEAAPSSLAMPPLRSESILRTPPTKVVAPV
jgi:hypothetical protein